MKTPKKKPSATNKNAQGITAGNGNATVPAANKRIFDDEDDDEFDNSFDDLGGLDNFDALDDDDDF